MLWAQRSAALILGTAFEDGACALAVGAELRIVGKDGAILQSLRVPDDEVLSTPPAIAADGSIWVATGKGLYAAR